MEPPDRDPENQKDQPFSDERREMDRLLDQYNLTTDPRRKKDLLAKMEIIRKRRRVW